MKVIYKVNHSSFPQTSHFGFRREESCGKHLMKGGHQYMTRNQIDYLRTRNQAVKDQLDAEIARKTLSETNRANLARELETERSNKAKETTNALQTAINAAQSQEQIRANQAREAETHRANLVNEGIGRQNASSNAINASTRIREAQIAAINAQTNRQNADTNLYQADIANTRNLSQLQVNDANKRLQQQNAKESEAREAYYRSQVSGLVPSTIAKNVTDSLRKAAELVLLFK
nr:putative ORF1 [Marmot picobirnavirus]